MIHNTKFLLLLTTALLIVSCVPNKKITWLQYTQKHDAQISAGEGALRYYETPYFNYQLQPNDLLDIKISTLTPLTFNPFNDADRSIVPGVSYAQSGLYVQSQGYYIDPAGYLELPIIGRVQVAGLTITQAQDSIASVVQKYLEKPVVRLKLLNFRFSVVGEVENESTLQAGDNYLSLVQALSMAGGVSEFGDISKIKLIRHSGEETYVYNVNLLKEDFLSSPLYYVQPNDVIVVPPLPQRSFLKYVNPNLSILATTVSLIVAVFTLVSTK